MSYKDQFYNEGLATTFCVKPIKYIKKKIKNKKMANCICMLIKILYTLVAIAFAIIMFKVNFPL